MKPSTPRPYNSPLRKAQAERTRAHIVSVATAFLQEHEPAELGLPKVARLAEVAVGTVYAHFPTEDDLLLAVCIAAHQRMRIESNLELELLKDEPLHRFPRFALERRISGFAATFPPFQRWRADARPALKAAVVSQLRTLAPDLTDAELTALAGPIFAMTAPRVWFYFEDLWGLSTEDAARAASWAIRAMLNELRRDPNGLRTIPAPSPPLDPDKDP